MVGSHKGSIDFMWQCTLNMTDEGINIWPLQISAPLRSTTWIGKTIRFIWLFRPKTAEITIRYTRATSITFKYMVDKLEQSWATVHKKYCQNGGQKKKLAGKNHIRAKTRQEIWVGSMDHALKSPSYEGYTTGRLQPTITKHVFQQNKVNSK